MRALTKTQMVLWICFGLLVLAAYRMFASALASQPYFYILTLCVFIVGGGLLILGLIRLVQEKQWVACVLLVAAAFGIFRLPLADWYEDGRFARLQPQMEQTAEALLQEGGDKLVDEGELGWMDGTLYQLSEEKTLSRGGNVVFVEEAAPMVFFYSIRENSGISSGYAYLPEGSFPYTEDDGLRHLEELGGNWYYCVFATQSFD